MSKRRSSCSQPESNLNTAKRARLKSPTRVIDVDADTEPMNCKEYTGVAEDELEELEKSLIVRFEARRIANQGRIGVRATPTASSLTGFFVKFFFLFNLHFIRRLRPLGLLRGLSCASLCVINI
jgi:hypothetical protein